MTHIDPAATSPANRSLRSSRVTLSAPAPGRRTVALVVLGCLAAGSGVALTGGLMSDSATPKPDRARPLSAAEAQRLATMRLTNYREARAGVHATVGSPGSDIHLAGWVDWTRPLVYLAVAGPGAGAQQGLLQAGPGVIATRHDPAAVASAATAVAPASGTASPAAGTVSPPGATDGGSGSAGAGAPGTASIPAMAPIGGPPPVPPVDGWRVRPFAASGLDRGPVESFIALLLAVTNDRADTAAVLQRSEARWLGRERVAGTTVDVLLGPAMLARPGASPVPGSNATAPPERGADSSPSRTAETSLAAMGGAVRYWLDGDARLHRFEALLPGNVPVQARLDRTDRPRIAAIDALGGGTITPRAVSAVEANLLTRMRQRNRARGGGEVTLTVPTVPAANLRGTGWVDWRNSVAYLAVYDMDKPTKPTLLRAERWGVAVRAAPVGVTTGAFPPLPPPRERPWTYADWDRRGDAHGGLDVDLLVNEVLALSGTVPDDAGVLRRSAAWLRTDSVGGNPVTVFEIPKPAEAGGRRGDARLRYWVDRSATLRRLELRTRSGAFAQLDVDPGEVPYVAPVPLA
jgi:hypothetical protein